MGHQKTIFTSKGFALPTVLIASVVLLTVLAVSVSATAAIRTSLKTQYYAQMAQVAGEAGVAYAKACLAANGNVPQWTNEKPLKPSTDCAGNDELLAPKANALVVAGGGSGGGSVGGGGGGGGVLMSNGIVVATGNYTVSVGAGGAGVAFKVRGITGGNSSITGPGVGTVTAQGGGGGGFATGASLSAALMAGLPGGSGGGGQKYYSTSAPGAGTSGQGFNGGPLGTPAGTTGGGGAAGLGLTSPGTNAGGDGGPGVGSSISGTLLYYGGGGGGGGSSTSNFGNGGIGGGGSGAAVSSVGTAGIANTGGGGGGGWSYTAGGSGAGGSGIVVISYPANGNITATGGTITTVNGNKIHTFTSSGTFNISAINTASCPSDPRCNVSTNGNMRSSFSVGLPTLDSEGKALTIPQNGYVEITRSSNGAVWRTYRQPSVQPAAVPNLCSGVATSLLGWGNAVRSGTQDSFGATSLAQSITLADTVLSAGQIYFRKDFSVTTSGTYTVNLQVPNPDKAELYIGSKKIITSEGDFTSGTTPLTPGCYTAIVRLTNTTYLDKATRFNASIHLGSNSAPIVATDSSWRVSTGNLEHFSSPNYYVNPAVWTLVKDYNSSPVTDNVASRGITPPYAIGTNTSVVYRDNRLVTVTDPTEVKVILGCTVSCSAYVDGQFIGGGVAAEDRSYTITLQPGDHTFGVKHLASGSNPTMYMTVLKTADNSVLTQSDPNWSTPLTSTNTNADYYSYDATYNPQPNTFLRAYVDVLAVGGGGGGGTGMGGGGGGGGYFFDTNYLITDSINIVVGAGGAGAAGGPGTTRGANGDDTFVGLTRAIGGGGGGSRYTTNTLPPGSGGSGGGVAGNTQITTSIGIVGQGNPGGPSGGTYYPSGGGGALSPGGTNPGYGGAGRSNSILGTAYAWGGGGGGSGYTGPGGNGGGGGGGGGAIGTTTGGSGYNNGSPGGGGATVFQANTPGGNGGANTGGGGGGGSHTTSTGTANKGGNGGSGIVVISYSTGTITATGGTRTTVGTRTVHTFTSDGTFRIVSIP